MKRFILINLFVAFFGILIGVVVWMYLKIYPIDKSEYDMFVYFLNSENKVEQTMLARQKGDAIFLINYYQERKNKSSKDVTIAKDMGTFFIIPMNSKAKLIDTIDVNLAKIRLLYRSDNNEIKTISGYLPLSNLHKKAAPPN